MANISNTIRVKVADMDHYEELAKKTGSAPLKPGYLLDYDDLGVFPHGVFGGLNQRGIVIEDSLQGSTIDTFLSDGDVTRHIFCEPGDVVLGVVPAGTVALVKGNNLISNGDGRVVPTNAVGSGVLYKIVADSTAVTNTTAETTFSNGSYAIPANSLKVGDVIRLRGQVTFPATNSTDTATIKVKIGSTILATSGALDVANGDACTFDLQMVVRTIGASGTIVASGTISIGTPGTATAKEVTLASTAIDTTAIETITVTCTWSVANAGNQAVLSSFVTTRDSSVANAPVARVEVDADYSLSASDGYVFMRFI